MNSRYAVVVMVVVFAVCIGTVFAKEWGGSVTAVDMEKGSLSLRNGKEIVEFECAPGTLKKQVRKGCDVTVEYTDEAGKKKVTKITGVHCGC
jgi:hypothetical protein